ncbi:hypothetical protein BUALT_Bualt15G0040700 [Buddleja alternifolia]|uniref:DUF674 family protein n=1 Tax=Buddleja alternifolia TaxID=168488 RepID=A0AAV6WIZ8_9LAMI|nr:hypothetical protein BUALT_Bualt15G0040700 [Buddleja alternifolia]
MSNSEEVKFTLKVVMNKKKNKVLYAEVDSSFADVLLSFMTLPLGTIVRLLAKHFAHQSPTIGSLNTLYQGLANLESSHFCTDTGKQILLNARNSLAPLCKKLKLNLDDSEPTKYFTCRSSSLNFVAMNRAHFKCDGNPAKLFDREIILQSSKIQTADKNGGVFAKETTTFLITDHLQIVPNSIMDLLKGLLVSKTPLSDLIFKRQMVSATTISPLPRTGEGAASKKIIVNAMIRKSTNKVLLVQADEDFINFLFSLLVIPLGTVVHLLGTNTCIGSVDNLYSSITNLECGKYLKTEDLKSILLKPQLPPEYLSKNHIFSHTEDITLVMPYSVSKVSFVDDNGTLGYVKGPATFMVTDDLVVTPFSAFSSLSLMKKLKIPVSDVEELQFEVGINEALNILKASLMSTSALTDGLKPISKRRVKQENFADVLLSFLTLPLGTIVRLLAKHFADQSPTIGSLNTLYQGLANLESSHFCTVTELSKKRFNPKNN